MAKRGWNGITKLTTKRGRYAVRKFKAFSILAELPAGYYCSVRELCLASGLTYYSLARALPNWVLWDYVTRYPMTECGQGDYMYRLLPHGRSWFRLAMVQLPNANLFRRELEIWRNQVMDKAMYESLLTLPFNDFVTQLHELVKASDISQKQGKGY